MLKDRILSTLKFFDLQDYPLTLLELHQFLLEDFSIIQKYLDSNWEIVSQEYGEPSLPVTAGEILKSLETECQGLVENYKGFYFLRGKEPLVKQRLSNYCYGIKRERLIRRYIPILKHLPFVRGAALTGSQALGQQKDNSDIDLLVITDPKFMWLTRTLITAYFHIIGLRRHGEKVANRFCLNHYLAGPKKLSELRNLYTAMEYIKMRPLIYEKNIFEFQKENLDWIKVFFPNWQIVQPEDELATKTHGFLEKIFNNAFGLALEKRLKNWLAPRIKKQEFILVKEDELSFHPQSRQKFLLTEFFRPSPNFQK